MKKLRIGEIGPLNVPIPPVKYGGTEHIIHGLCDKLTERGHKVFLFAAEDSKTKANLIPIIQKSLWAFRQKESAPYYAYEMAVIARMAEKLNLDILHDHLGPWSLSLYGQLKMPIVHTLHVPLNEDRIWAYKKLNSPLISISNAQRKPAPNLNYVATIYNGMSFEYFKFNPRPKNQFVWVGELSPRKGILEVIKIAKLARIDLVIAGRIPSPSQAKDYQFFNKHIKRELNKGRIRYAGEITHKNLGRYYGSARAFLYPLQWEEPFGLTIIESMACGTPVIALDKGSMSELIKNGENGFVVKNLNQMLAAIKKIDQINRKNCREYVEKEFNMENMVDRYEKAFLKVIGWPASN